MKCPKLATALLLATIVSACVSMGREVTSAQMAAFEKGKTTQAQVIAALGPPSNTTSTSTGKTTLTYTHMKGTPKPQSFIPIVGPLVAGADIHTTQATLIFSADGVLESFSHTEGDSAGGAGLVDYQK